MTKEKTMMDRRSFFALAGVGAGAAALAAGCAPQQSTQLGETGDMGKTEEGTASASNWLGSAPEIADDEIVETRETDILIVGTGNAGMSGAATATDLGLDFMVCEASATMASPRHWVGAINTAYHEQAGFHVDESKLLNEMSRYASGKCDPSVWKVWIRESAEMIDFIDGIMKGAGMEMFLDTEGYDHATGGTDFYVPPIQHMWYDPSTAVPPLMSLSGMMSPKDRNVIIEEYMASKGHSVSYQHTLVKLIREEGGRVEGAIFETPDGYVRIDAHKAVLLATGGYAANPTMMRALAPTAAKATTSPYFIPTNTGGGIKAGLWVGAAMDGDSAPMIFDRGIVEAGVDTDYTSEGDDAAFGGPGIMLPIGSLPFMKVNRNGKRFANESTPYDFFAFAASRQPGGVWCTIFDSNMQEDSKRFSVVGCAKIGTELLQTSAIEDEKIFLADCLDKGLIVKADTLEELVDKLGLPKEETLAEIARYNELYEKQIDEDFGKEAFRLSAISKAPYYGYWCGGLLLTTLDGLTINADMQVLDTESNVIEGLYAAGDCSGSLFSGNYPEYLVGCASGRTLTEGRHAIRHIAGDLA